MAAERAIVMSGDFAIGNPERRPRTRTMSGDFETARAIPGQVLVLLEAEMDLRPAKILVSGELRDT